MSQILLISMMRWSQNLFALCLSLVFPCLSLLTLRSIWGPPAVFAILYSLLLLLTKVPRFLPFTFTHCLCLSPQAIFLYVKITVHLSTGHCWVTVAWHFYLWNCPRCECVSSSCSKTYWGKEFYLNFYTSGP